jgi:hypothetical protein
MEAEEGIRRVVWLPKELDRQIEEVRRRIGYSRSGIYRYILTRYFEKTFLTKRKKVQLQPWEEIIGTLKAIETDNQTISAVVTCTQSLDIAITYPKETAEATILQNLNSLLGQKIALLKTDNPEKPLLIRTFNETTNAHKEGLGLLWFRKSLLWVAFKVFVALRFSLLQSGLRLFFGGGF